MWRNPKVVFDSIDRACVVEIIIIENGLFITIRKSRRHYCYIVCLVEDSETGLIL